MKINLVIHLQIETTEESHLTLEVVNVLREFCDYAEENAKSDFQKQESPVSLVNNTAEVTLFREI